MGAGGVITLDEPLSIEELQTGALVLLMTRDGQPCEAVGVVELRSVGVIDSIQFYAFGRPVAEVVTGASVTDITNGVFQVRISDNAGRWQVVGARIDRQYWHGVASAVNIGISRVDPGPPTEGAPYYLFVSLQGFAVTGSVVCEGVPRVGGPLSSGRVKIYDGDSALDSYVPIEFSSFEPVIETLAIKAVLVIIEGYVKLRVLYPGAVTMPEYTLTDYGGEPITPSSVGPWYAS